MKRIQIQRQAENRTIPVKINSNNQTFKTSVYKVSNSIQTISQFNKTTLSTSTNTSSSKIETKTDINNQPVEDLYYDEVIYYDGGGVEGYGH